MDNWHARSAGFGSVPQHTSRRTGRAFTRTTPLTCMRRRKGLLVRHAPPSVRTVQSRSPVFLQSSLSFAFILFGSRARAASMRQEGRYYLTSVRWRCASLVFSVLFLIVCVPGHNSVEGLTEAQNRVCGFDRSERMCSRSRSVPYFDLS